MAAGMNGDYVRLALIFKGKRYDFFCQRYTAFHISSIQVNAP